MLRGHEEECRLSRDFGNGIANPYKNKINHPMCLISLLGALKLRRNETRGAGQHHSGHRIPLSSR
jgi:hypothetical protein